LPGRSPTRSSRRSRQEMAARHRCTRRFGGAPPATSWLSATARIQSTWRGRGYRHRPDAPRGLVAGSWDCDAGVPRSRAGGAWRVRCAATAGCPNSSPSPPATTAHSSGPASRLPTPGRSTLFARAVPAQSYLVAQPGQAHPFARVFGVHEGGPRTLHPLTELRCATRTPGNGWAIGRRAAGTRRIPGLRLTAIGACLPCCPTGGQRERCAATNRPHPRPCRRAGELRCATRSCAAARAGVIRSGYPAAWPVSPWCDGWRADILA